LLSIIELMVMARVWIRPRRIDVDCRRATVFTFL